MATQAQGFGGRALMWLRDVTWDGVERLPGVVGLLILVITYGASTHKHVLCVWAWVTVGAVLIIGNWIWLRNAARYQATDEYRKNHDWVVNWDLVDQEKHSLWFNIRCQFAEWLVFRAIMVGPPGSQQVKYLVQCNQEYSKRFHKRVFVERDAPDTAPASPPARTKYIAFMAAHPMVEGVVWFIPGTLLPWFFGYFSFLDWSYEKIDIGTALSVIFAAAGTVVALSGIWRIAQGWPQRNKSLAASNNRDAPFEDKRPLLNLGAFAPSLPSINFPSIIRYGRTSPRAAALIDASRCWGVIIAAFFIAQRFVPVWQYEDFPTDERAYVWYAAGAVIFAAFVAYLMIQRGAKGPFDTRLMGRSFLQLVIGVGLLIGSSKGAALLHAMGAMSSEAQRWSENILGLIAIWLLVTASAKIIMLPWIPRLGRK